MELIRGLHNLRPRHHGCVATIGAFDGVHLGHQAVIRHLLEKSVELALPSLIIVFEPLPREYFSPLKAPALSQTFSLPAIYGGKLLQYNVHTNQYPDPEDEPPDWP